jgi:hypothetical protein
MNEEQFDFIDGKFIDGLPPSSSEEKFKYYKFLIEKTLYTEIFVKVPEKFDPKKIDSNDISDLLDDQCIGDSDWDNMYEMEWSFSEIDEKLATKYGFSELTL